MIEPSPGSERRSRPGHGPLLFAAFCLSCWSLWDDLPASAQLLEGTQPSLAAESSEGPPQAEPSLGANLPQTEALPSPAAGSAAASSGTEAAGTAQDGTLPAATACSPCLAAPASPAVAANTSPASPATPNLQGWNANTREGYGPDGNFKVEYSSGQGPEDEARSSALKQPWLGTNGGYGQAAPTQPVPRRDRAVLPSGRRHHSFLR